MEIKTDSSNRVLVKANQGFGRYGYNRNWIQLKQDKKGNYFMVNKKKMYCNDLKHEDFVLTNCNNEIVSCFYIEL